VETISPEQLAAFCVVMREHGVRYICNGVVTIEMEKPAPHVQAALPDAAQDVSHDDMLFSMTGIKPTVVVER
jgi:hypothetical protein